MIYTITTVRNIKSSRAVGYYETLDEARSSVSCNENDIYENGYYPYAVIEEVEPGIYTFPREEHWYEWDNRTEGYKKITKPEKFRMICLWSLG